MAIPAWFASIRAGPLARVALEAFDRARAAGQDRRALEAELEKALATSLAETAAAELRARSGVLISELKGESWLQRNWRPLVAIAFAAVIVFYGLILPIAVDWFGLPPLRVGDTLLGWIMTSVNIAIGGYIGGRTLEKIARALRQ